MDDLNKRLGDATTRVAHLLAERTPALTQDLSAADREVFAKEMIELELRQKQTDVEEKELSLVIRRYKALVELGVELDVVTKIELRQYVSSKTRQLIKDKKVNKDTCTGWLNGRPI